ncbi:LysR family transcriptional regulator [Rouxiella silvae]|uniref:LysR family transcriptional regulator n=1 Tax=Rouxiella silvae TaxID=1646373 RepID=A0AA41BWQ9_9GAMM|nr:LysR family transcriptional regulator [Rouxiella silvae]KQN52399.1 LysR family transcriptional regulator [Serratia sp. Leaf50]MBF6637154.1 LysR family transcriptional regulator [Rouxiella silvae]ORJ21715.1 LysR family transcriptional regulator [Rouxiella silvae]
MTSLNDLDLRQLEAFSAVISSGSVTAAAKVLQRSQPAVSRLIQDLENAMGYPLFLRNGPRIHPTEQALRLHEYVETALISLQQIRLRANEIWKEEKTPLLVAATPSMASGLLPMALAKINLDDAVQILSDSAEQTAHAIITAQAELGVSSLPLEHQGVLVHWIGQSRCVLALKESDPLAQKSQISLGDLADRKLITPYNPYRLRRRYEQVLRKAKVKPAGIIETNSSVNILACIRAGLGVAILEPVTAYGLPLSGVVLRELDVDIPYYFGVTTPLSKPPRPIVLALIEALKQAAASILPEFVCLEANEHARVMQSLHQE